VKRVIITQPLSLDDLNTQGRNFKWNKPSCPCGSNSVWGHGFVCRYFAGFQAPFWIRRFRCSSCRTVFTMRPSSHPPGIQTGILDICLILFAKFTTSHWKKSTSRQRNLYWLKKLLELRRFPAWEPLSHLKMAMEFACNPFRYENLRVDTG
jgi:hypothetical protein